MSRSLTIDGEQLSRLMQICRLIGGSRHATLQQLQRKMRASRRTIFRDLKGLEAMGIKVDLDGKGYQIRQGPVACRKIIKTNQLKVVNRLLARCL